MIEWLHNIKPNKNAYELAYGCIHYFIPYFITRAALKWNKFSDIEVWWRYWTHLFIATGKTNYSLMSIRFLMLMKSLHPKVKAVFNQNRVLSFSGKPGTGVPMDGVCELVCSM